MVQDENGRLVKAPREIQMRAFKIAEEMIDRLRGEPYPDVAPVSMAYGTFIKCCGKLNLPKDISMKSTTRIFKYCCREGLVSDFVLTQLRYALPRDKFAEVLAESGYEDVNIMDKENKRVRWANIPSYWTRNVNSSKNNKY
mmetsp:Transcript_4429/g.9140  ORF Transcript_4429/g.9140 Transcript_4429/m.9140 type:complete len:141 (-) Transcript_4429:357-779(-)